MNVFTDVILFTFWDVIGTQENLLWRPFIYTEALKLLRVRQTWIFYYYKLYRTTKYFQFISQFCGSYATGAVDYRSFDVDNIDENGKEMNLMF